jgi:hypothetical protein
MPLVVKGEPVKKHEIEVGIRMSVYFSRHQSEHLNTCQLFSKSRF